MGARAIHQVRGPRRSVAYLYFKNCGTSIDAVKTFASYLETKGFTSSRKPEKPSLRVFQKPLRTGTSEPDKPTLLVSLDEQDAVVVYAQLRVDMPDETYISVIERLEEKQVRIGDNGSFYAIIAQHQQIINDLMKLEIGGRVSFKPSPLFPIRTGPFEGEVQFIPQEENMDTWLYCIKTAASVLARRIPGHKEWSVSDFQDMSKLIADK